MTLSWREVRPPQLCQVPGVEAARGYAGQCGEGSPLTGAALGAERNAAPSPADRGADPASLLPGPTSPPARPPARSRGSLPAANLFCKQDLGKKPDAPRCCSARRRAQTARSPFLSARGLPRLHVAFPKFLSSSSYRKTCVCQGGYRPGPPDVTATNRLRSG